MSARVVLMAVSLLACGCPGEDSVSFVVTDAEITFLHAGTAPDDSCRQLCLLRRAGIDASTGPDGGFVDPGWIRADLEPYTPPIHAPAHDAGHARGGVGSRRDGAPDDSMTLTAAMSRCG